ncbi:thiamine pyrophosphate-requiring protein [Streptomyces sp. HD1123-B1]|uniref:thiamine pyrophosphate-requiring protein n=1 Tax=Streptomyces huangiella TaxID=3228804 RepID=UPI003D7E3176
MTGTVADHLLARLGEWGVAHVFGCPGDGLGGLLAAWERVRDAPRFIRSGHEELSALEAVGYARFSGRLGVCAAPSGPGAIQLLGGLYDARLDRVPVVALVGQTPRSAMGGSYPREVDLPALFHDVAAAFLETVTVPEQLPNVLDRAIRTAYARRAPTAVIVPSDVQELAYAPPGHASAMVPSSLDRSGWSAVPSGAALERAAEVLNAGDRVAVLIGRGAVRAGAEVRRVAERLGAGVAKALLGLDALSDELPYVTGPIGPLGTRPSYELMRDCDTLLTVGSSFPYSQYLPESGAVRAVQIDLDPHMIGLRYPYEVNLVGDARETLLRLLPLLHRAEDRDWQDGVVAGVRRWRRALARRAALPADPLNPEFVADRLDPLLPPDTIVTCDSGAVTPWYARHLRMRGELRAALSGTLGTAGCAVPYAIGAKFARPERPVVALAGDGGMRRTGLAGLVTAAAYRDAWENPRLVIGVWHDREDGGAASQGCPEVPYAGFARSLGLTGIRVERPEYVEQAWREALGADGPAVVEFRTDPGVTPLPPDADWAEWEGPAETGEEDGADAGAAGTVRRGFGARAREFLPHRGEDR